MEKTEMEFPHQGNSLTAAYPLFGPANSRTLQNEIKREGYVEPTFPELTSFIHHCYFNGEPAHVGKIDEIMKTKYFVGFTGVLYLPGKNEVCFIDHPSLERASVVDSDYLQTIQRLHENCNRVNLDDVETGSVPWNKIANNPLFRAVGGCEEGAEKLAELASRHSDKNGYIFVPKISNFSSPQARIILMYSYGGGKSLTVTLNGSGSSRNSYSVGLLKAIY
jgi:hypothetical protein